MINHIGREYFLRYIQNLFLTVWQEVLQMEYEKLLHWFTDTEMGIYTSSLERHFFEHISSSTFSGKSVQFGMEEWLMPSEKCICVGRDIHMHSMAWPWERGSLDLIVMPHTLDNSLSTPYILTEAFRALSPEGQLVLTGFNPYSLWRFRNWFNGKYLPEAHYCHALSDLKNQLSKAGFQIEQGRFMVYLPPVQTKNAIKLFHFMENAGNRWWPHAAAVYGLVARKRIANIRISGEWTTTEENDMEIVLGTAKVEP
ncbi:class I SAM-dependent methyltransferase [Neisseria dumasiana]|nr:methyltransferase [Neisseria dumasiana]